jgi:hypothetical protein
MQDLHKTDLLKKALIKCRENALSRRKATFHNLCATVLADTYAKRVIIDKAALVAKALVNFKEKARHRCKYGFVSLL